MERCYLQRPPGGNEMSRQLLYNFRPDQAAWGLVRNPLNFWCEASEPSLSDLLCSHWQPVVKSGIQDTSIWSLPWSTWDSYLSTNYTWRDKCLLHRLWKSCHSAAASGRWGRRQTFPPLLPTPAPPHCLQQQGVQLILLLMLRRWGRNSFQRWEWPLGKEEKDVKKQHIFKTPEWTHHLIQHSVQGCRPGQGLRCLDKQKVIPDAQTFLKCSHRAEIQPLVWGLAFFFVWTPLTRNHPGCGAPPWLWSTILPQSCIAWRNGWKTTTPRAGGIGRSRLSRPSTEPYDMDG